MGAGSGELAGWRTSGAGGVEGDDFGLENTLSDTPTLRDHLLAQMGVEIAAPGDRLIAAHLIDLVDPAGYLSGSIEPIAERSAEHTSELQSLTRNSYAVFCLKKK